MNRADFSKDWQKMKDEKSTSGDGEKSSAEFKIALAVINLTEDFEALQEWFASLKEQAGKKQVTVARLN